METVILSIVVALIAGLFSAGGIVAFRKVSKEKDLLSGQTEGQLSQAWRDFVEPLRQENADLRDRVTRLEERLTMAHGLERDRDRMAIRVMQLKRALENAGIEIPTPLQLRYHEPPENA